MKRYLHWLLLFVFLSFLTSANAQFELAHLSSKSYSSFGFGTPVIVGFPLANGNALTSETDVNYLNSAVTVSLAQIGYRHTFTGK
jgi:hypothetical protein